MSKTIKQLAEELSVTKSCLRHKIEVLNLQSKLKKIGNQFVIDSKQEKLIINSLKNSYKNNDSKDLSEEPLDNPDSSNQDLTNQNSSNPGLLNQDLSNQNLINSKNNISEQIDFNLEQNQRKYVKNLQQGSDVNNFNNDSDIDLNNNQNNLYQALKAELAIKDSQISALIKQLSDLINQNSQLTIALQNTTESLKSAQALHAGTIKQQLSDNNQESKTKKWWNFWK